LGIARSEGIVRFEGFELNLRTAELRDANGKTVSLSEQPLRILVALLERPGELVLRENLRKRLWPNDTVVEFEHSINAAINRLRHALGDSAENPKFIETLARRGYRWKSPVQWEQPQAARTPTQPHSVDGNLIAKRVSHYRVLEILGGGGMGVVYKAEDIKLGRRVALKFLPEELAGDPAAIQRLEREARAASALNHPNICTIHAVEEHEGQPFIAMELLEGQSLRDMVSQSGVAVPLELKTLQEIAAQIADGLEAAHQKGIIHRDIKPANIFVSNRGQVKILDFGLAKLHDAESAETRPQASTPTGPITDPLLTLTRTGVTIGTAAYMSPEQVRGEPLDARTDLFSFGLVIYEMATGQRAFVGDTAPVLHDAIVNLTPTPVRDLNPQVPAKLEVIINKAIQKDRVARYQTASEIRADLETLQGRKESLRSRWWWVAAAGIVSLLAAGASLFFARRQQQPLPVTPDLKLRQLTANSPENRVQDGRISPDGKYLAYVDLKGIQIKAIDTGAVRTVARPEALRNRRIDWAFGAWSPDSTRLIVNAHPATGAGYLTEFEADENLSIWEFPLRGGTPQLLRDRAWADSISPDGSLISFRANRSGSGPREIWLMDPIGSNAQKLFENDAVGGLGWSPDGRHAWYLRDSGHQLRDADFKWLSFPWQKDHIPAGSLATDITPSFGMDNTFDASVLPDGRFLYSVRENASIGSETCNFWTAQRDPQTDKPLGKPRQLTHWTGFCMSDVSVTRDGKHLAYLQWSGHPVLYVADLHVGRTRVTNERHFTGSESSELWADWTPDSKSLIFWSNRSGRHGIYRQSLNEDTPEQLVSSQNGLAVCCVSPDGRWFIYRVRSWAATYQINEGSGQPSNTLEEVMRVPVTGGPPEDMFSVKRLNWWGCARASSNLCAVAEIAEDRSQAIITAFDPLKGRGAEFTRIPIEPNRDWALALSRDGTRFAFIRGPGSPLQILSLKGKVLQEIKIPEWSPAGPIEWAVDGKGLFVPRLTPGGASLEYVSLKGEVRVIRESRGGNYSPGLPSPDGRHIAMVGTATNSNMWMMENF
jgi:serine/threonine protein kinase/Tol biopolymer transport system component